MTEAFIAAGGIVYPISDRDLRVFAALPGMGAPATSGFQDWLVSRRPASGTDFFRAFFGDSSMDRDEPTHPATGRWLRHSRVAR